MLKSLPTLLFVMMTTMLLSQETPVSFSRELSFTNENDAYLFNKRDAYYTNGIIFRLTNATEKKGLKITGSYELGQMIYTPLIRKTQGPADIDRPYCGYLFARYNRTRFSQDDAVFQYGATLGMMGGASLGENLQNSYHKLLGYGRFTGWQYQVNNGFGADLGLLYARTAWEDSSWLKLVPVVQVNLGTNFTNARIGAYLCLGSFEKNGNSAMWNARVQTARTNNRKRYELYGYWYPQLMLQGYNATVEGGLFGKSGKAVLGESERWLFQQQFGICFARDRWTTRLELVWQGREAVMQKNTHQYGSMQVSYRLH